MTGSKHAYFKEPRQEDIYPTDASSIVKHLPTPLIIKMRLCFDASEFSGLLVR